MGTKFAENFITHQSFVKKDITTVFLQFLQKQKKNNLNFSTVDQKLFNVLFNASNEELSNFDRPF